MLQPIDLGHDRLQFSGKEGILVGDDGAVVPGRVQQYVGTRFVAACTKGDGGCGVHAIWGAPNRARELEAPGGQLEARRRLVAQLPQSLRECEVKLEGWEPLEFLKESLWEELGRPAATKAAKMFADPSPESNIFWAELRKQNPKLLATAIQFVQAEAQALEQRNLQRSRYREACNNIFRPEFEIGIVRPIAEMMRSHDFIVDSSPSSRYSSLFIQHGVPEYDVRRQSFLEAGGSGVQAQKMSVLEAALLRFTPSSTEHRLIREWMSSYMLLMNGKQQSQNTKT